MLCSIKRGNRYHQDLYYEDEDSDFETLGIPSDEETRHINEVPLQKGNKKGNSSNAIAMTDKPTIPPKPRWTPAMDISQINNNDESVRKRTRALEKKEITTSMPAVRNSEKPSMPKQLSLQPIPAQRDANISTIHSGVEQTPSTTCTDRPSLLNNAYQPPNLSNLKFGNDSPIPNTPNSPDAIVKNSNTELVPFANAVDEKSPSPEISKTNSTPHSGNSTKLEDGEMFKSLSIDSGEHDEVISDGEDEVMEENHHDEVVELPAGDEETAKGKLKY